MKTVLLQQVTLPTVFIEQWDALLQTLREIPSGARDAELRAAAESTEVARLCDLTKGHVWSDAQEAHEFKKRAAR